jgi:hypothetical protein
MLIVYTKPNIYSRLDYIKEATKNYTPEATPADLTGVLQQVEPLKSSSALYGVPASIT